MVELHAAWTQAARVGATAGRAGAAEAEEAAEEAAEDGRRRRRRRRRRQRRRRSCCWAASGPMQPIPLLLSAEEGGRLSLTLVSGSRPLAVPPQT